MQPCHQMHTVHPVGAAARARHAAVCAIAAFDMVAPAGSWSYNGLTTRKPGLARLTSVSAT